MTGVGKGHGNRITKPPSAKQKANGQKYAAPSIVLAPSDSGLPTRSWWLNCSREEFDKTLAEESKRMKLSRFGRLASGLAEG